MTIPLSLPEDAPTMDPVIVCSPRPRCGTTLVQRLLCSAPNTLVFGEQLAGEFRIFAETYRALEEVLGANAQMYGQRLQRVVAGDVDDWIVNLMPPPDVYLRAKVAGFYETLRALKSTAASFSRPVWGAKTPEMSTKDIVAFHRFVPRAKYVYVFRDLRDTLRSAISRGFVKTNADVEAFTQQWAENLSGTTAIASKLPMLLLKYEDMLADPAGHIARMEAFTGSAGIRPEVMGVKINSWATGYRGTKPTLEYVEPSPLSPAHEAAIAAGLAGRAVPHYQY